MSSKIAIRSVASLFSGGKLIAKLPEMSAKLAIKIADTKTFKRFAGLANNEEVLSALKKRIKDLSDGGKQFLDDFADASDDVLKKFVEKPELVDAWKRLQSLGASSATRKLITKFDIANVRPGTNGKYAIIGRKMSGYVDECAKELEKIVGEGNVVILDDAWLKKANSGMEKTFHIDAYDAKLSNGELIHFEAKDWTVNSAWENMSKPRNKSVYDPYRRVRNSDDFIPEIDVPQIPMYKVNEKWINEMKSNGYEIINIGNPFGIDDGPFFKMEKTIMNF